jgi:hypothetical protein
VEDETIRARRIELYDDQGRRTVALEGGGDGTQPGFVLLGPEGRDGGPATIAMLSLRLDAAPYLLLHGGRGAVLITFGEGGEPRIALRDEDGNERVIEL